MKDLIERFTEKIEEPFDVHNDCWIWEGSKTAAGYGNLGLGSRQQGNVYAHRLSYELFVGPISDGLQIDHLCRNRGCVNPSHLEVVPQIENIRRGEGSGFQINAAKTHCPRGHPYDEKNTRHYKRERGGERICRACERIRYYRRKGGC